MKTTGRAITVRVNRSQNPPFGSWSPSIRARFVNRGQLIRSPSRRNSAGSNVIVAAIEARTTRIAPAAIDRKIVVGRMNIPSSAKTTVIPLNRTARLAVAPVAEIAPSRSKPFIRSSR